MHRFSKVPQSYVTRHVKSSVNRSSSSIPTAVPSAVNEQSPDYFYFQGPALRRSRLAHKNSSRRDVNVRFFSTTSLEQNDKTNRNNNNSVNIRHKRRQQPRMNNPTHDRKNQHRHQRNGHPLKKKNTNLSNAIKQAARNIANKNNKNNRATSRNKQRQQQKQSVSVSPSTSTSSTNDNTTSSATHQKSGEKTISKFNKALQSLLQRHGSLPPLPIDYLTISTELHKWILTYSNNDNNEDEGEETKEALLEAIDEEYYKRKELYQDAITLSQAIQLSIESNLIFQPQESSPSSSSSYQEFNHKQKTQLTTLITKLLTILSNSPPTSGMGQQCTSLLSLLSSRQGKERQQLNLDLQSIHYQCAIQAFCLERRFKDAKALFGFQIDVEQGGGWTPMEVRNDVIVDGRSNSSDSSSSNGGWDCPVEMGLYAIAMSQNNDNAEAGMDAVNQVMEAVLSMCLVSPTDQDKYVLAAGAALGRAKKWQEFIHYLNTSDESERLGQPLIAATMLACIQNQKYNEALNGIYQPHILKDPANTEWQWGGGYGTVHPLCRDLALRAMGKTTDRYKTDENVFGQSSKDALLLLEQIMEENAIVSIDGIRGLLAVCEDEGDFESSIGIFHLLQNYDEKEVDWKIIGGGNGGTDYFLGSASDRSEMSEECLLKKGMLVDEGILTSVVKACNNAGEYGLALAYCQMGNMTFQHDNETEDDVVGNLVRSQPWLSTDDELLTATMISLSKLGCTKEAVMLHSSVQVSLPDDKDTTLSSECLGYINSLRQHSNTKWLEAHKHVGRMIYTLESINSSKDTLSVEEQELLLRGLTRMMKSCIDAGSFTTGLHLASLAASLIKEEQKSTNSMKDTFKSFLGIDSSETTDKNMFQDSRIKLDSKELISLLSSSDSLLSSGMEMYKGAFGIDEALAIFFDKWESDDDLRASLQVTSSRNVERAWINSINTALVMLVENEQVDDAITFFDSIPRNTRTPETYITIAKGFMKRNQWEDGARLFIDAKETGCLSEELGLLAMEAVAERTTKGKIRVLRSLADEIAEVAGTDSDAWISTRYWQLKRRLGFHHARLLMWWNNPRESQSNELGLAIRHFNKSKQNGTLVKNDVLRCIVRLAAHVSVLNSSNSNNSSTQDQDARRKKSVKLILEAVSEARRTSLGVDRTFSFEVARTLHRLGANIECISFVNDLIKQGASWNRTTIEEAYAAAEVEGDLTSLKVFSDLISKVDQ